MNRVIPTGGSCNRKHNSSIWPAYPSRQASSDSENEPPLVSCHHSEIFNWLTTVVKSAVKSGVVDRNSFAHVSVDSTVMEKNIAHPTDSAMLEKLRGKLVAFMQEHDLTIRQTYSRQGPRTAQKVGRYAHDKQFKRMRRQLRKLRIWVGRLQRELERQLEQLSAEAREKADELINLAKRLIEQIKNTKTKNKLYSLHNRELIFAVSNRTQDRASAYPRFCINLKWWIWNCLGHCCRN